MKLVAPSAPARPSDQDPVEFADGSVLTHADLLTLSATGSAADETITGTSGADVLNGQGGRDTITGLAGDDVLTGGLDADQLSGGLGADTYVFRAGDGQDVITEAGDAGSAVLDTLRIDGHALSDIRFSRTGAGGSDLTLRFANSADVIVIAGGFDPLGNGAIERFEVSAAATSLTLAEVLALLVPDAATSGQYLIGDAGDNALSGGDQGDYLVGGAGADTLSGGAGDDVFGDVGSDDAVDTLTGGTGRDTYRFLPVTGRGSAADEITDFTAGDAGDVIRLSGNNPNPFDTGALRVSQDGADVVVQLLDSGGVPQTIVRLLGVDAGDLTAFNFGGQPFTNDNSVSLY